MQCAWPPPLTPLLLPYLTGLLGNLAAPTGDCSVLHDDHQTADTKESSHNPRQVSTNQHTLKPSVTSLQLFRRAPRPETRSLSNDITLHFISGAVIG